MKLPTVVALAAFSLSCSQKEHDSAWWDNEKTIIELTNRLKLEQFRAEMMFGGSETMVSPEALPEASIIPADTSTIDSDIAGLLSRKNSLEKEITQLNEGWNDFRRDVLSQKRASVSGMSFDEYDPGNGKIYRNVKVTSIDDTGVAIRHSAGSARLRFSDLTPEGRAFFGLDEGFSHDALMDEREQRIAYEKWLEKGMAAKEAERLAAAETRKREEEKREAQRHLVAKNNASSSANASPLTASFGKLGDTKSGPRRTYYYSSYYGTRRSTYYRYYTPTPLFPSTYTSPSIYRPSVYPQSSGCGISIFDRP